MNTEQLAKQFVESTIRSTLERLANSETFKGSEWTVETFLKAMGGKEEAIKSIMSSSVTSSPVSPTSRSSGGRKPRKAYNETYVEGCCAYQFHGKGERQHKYEGKWCPLKAQPKNWERVQDQMIKHPDRFDSGQLELLRDENNAVKMAKYCGNHKLAGLGIARSPPRRGKKVATVPSIPPVKGKELVE